MDRIWAHMGPYDPNGGLYGRKMYPQTFSFLSLWAHMGRIWARMGSYGTNRDPKIILMAIREMFKIDDRRETAENQTIAKYWHLKAKLVQNNKQQWVQHILKKYVRENTGSQNHFLWKLEKCAKLRTAARQLKTKQWPCRSIWKQIWHTTTNNY